MEKIAKRESLLDQEASVNFKELTDDAVANSVVTEKLFLSGQDGEDEVNQRIEKITSEAIKNDARFRIAKLYYEAKNDIDSALKKAEEISNLDEQTRCLVHLAVAVLEKEGDADLADRIVANSKQDNEGYLKFYDQEKAKIVTEKQEK